MKIFGWAADRQGCGWYRIAVPLHGLREWGGHAVDASEHLPHKGPDPDLDGVDIVVGQRVCLPPATMMWQRICREGKVATVYEVDDDLLDVDASSERAYEFYGRPDIRANIVANAAAADMVTVSTDALAEVMSRYNRNVVVLPNALDPGLFEWNRPCRDHLTAGWAGSATHRMDLAEAAPGIRQFLRRHPDVGWHFVGEDYTRMVAGTDAALAGRIRHTGWRHDISAYYATLDFDIGIAPLRPHLFNRSKTWVKIAEYAALGIPYVATDFGPYAEWGGHGERGLLVRYPHEWPKALHTLASDQALREQMGVAARVYARQWSIEHRWKTWEDAYTSLLEGRVAA